MRMILFAVLYTIYKLLQFVFCSIFAAEKISRNTFCFFRILLRTIEDLLIIFCSETRNTKRRIFLLFSSVVRKFLSISLFPLCPLFLSLRSPLLRRKSRELIFSLRSIFLSTAQKKTRISLSALPAAACVLRVFFCRIESFILAKSAEENSQHSRIFLFFRGKKTLFSQEFFSQFSRRKLAIYLLYIKR